MSTTSSPGASPVAVLLTTTVLPEMLVTSKATASVPSSVSVLTDKAPSMPEPL